jgi:hypothetical protein
MSLDAALIQKMTQGINAPTVDQEGFFARCAVNEDVPNLTYDELPLLLATPKQGTDLTDANASIAVAAGNARVLPAATLTANRTLTLQTSGAVTGELMTIVRFGTEAYTFAIVNGGAGAGTKYTFPVSVARAAEFTYDGTNWNLARHWAI